MKRICALLLSVLLVFGMVTAVSAGFTDETTITAKYREAVAAMSDKGVIGGFPDGTFRPKGTLTRAQAAKILCTMLVGENVPDAASDFSDVPASHWASKYVAYCAAQGIAAGVGSGKFQPDGTLTGYAFGKMLLVANGHDAQAEGLTGAGWDTHTAALLSASDLDYNLKLSNGEITRQEACQLAYNFTLPAMDKSGFEDVTISMKEAPASYKTYGRTALSDDGLEVRWPGTAIEFTANLAGTVYMTYTSEQDCYLQVFVDGEPVSNRPQLKITSSPLEIKLASNIRSGQHSLRICQDGDAGKADETAFWKSVRFSGEKDSVAAALSRPLLIEYVGDSITSGKGTLIKGEVYTDEDHSATHGYAYLSAQLLDADWSLLSRGGMALERSAATGGSCPVNMVQAYSYLNGFAEEAQRIPYDFARKADVVVMALGTNDNAEDAVLKQHAQNLLAQIREHNGTGARIIVLANMMLNGKNAFLKAFAESNGLYYLEVTRNNDGGKSQEGVKGHPSAEGQAVIAQELADYIRTILPEKAK